MRRSVKAVGVIALSIAVATGCDSGSSAPTSGAADPPSPSAPAATTSAPGAADTGPQSKPTDAGPKVAEIVDESGGVKVTVTALRIGRHDGFDRVVYEFGGKGMPGWKVQYVDTAVQDGSGKPLTVAGRSILEVLISGAAYPHDSGVQEYSGPDPLRDPTATVVSEVHLATTFEGVTQSFVGVNADKPAFRVFALNSPTRIVVDVAS